MRIKSWLFWAHRWLGIATCLLCAMWFVTGLVMVYVPYPSWRDDERLAFLPKLDAGRVAVSPGEALAKASLTRAPTVFRLEMQGDEPVYRIVDLERPTSVSAVDGRLINTVDADNARRILAAATSSELAYIGILETDQWTVTRRFAAHRPLHLFEAADGFGTRYYLSSRTGEVVQSTTRRERLWNWIGSVPHWLYFTALRKEAGLWRDVVMWTAGLSAFGSVLGIWIGIIRVRVRRRYGGGRMSPYRGIMKWHHVSGLLAGIPVVTWLASGWLSVGPFGLLDSLPITPDQLSRYYTQGPPSFSASLSELKGRLGANAKEVQFSWVGARPIFATNDGSSITAFDAVSGERLGISERDIVSAATRVFPDRKIAAVERLDQFDAYWYAHRADRRVPALRLVFDDPDPTWLTADLTTGRIVDASASADRQRRWLFNFAHLYDHPTLLRHPVAREAIIWILSLGGIIVSLTGAFVGIRSLMPRRPSVSA